MVLGCGFAFMGSNIAFAQGNTVATLAAKALHNQMLPDNYDAWKRSNTRAKEIAPNKLLNSITSNGMTTHLVQLGWNVADQTAATAFEVKLKSQPGVSSVYVDFSSNKVQLVVKEEDEHNSLYSYFDIQ